MNKPVVRLMIHKEARECVDKIKETLAAMPERERKSFIEYALSLDKGKNKCLKY